MPFDAEWAESTADASSSRLVIAKAGGVAQTNLLETAAGYVGWKVYRSDWGYGDFNLSLTFPETEGEWTAALTRSPEGIVISVR